MHINIPLWNIYKRAHAITSDLMFYFLPSALYTNKKFAKSACKNKSKYGRLMTFRCHIEKYTLKQFIKTGEDTNNSFISMTTRIITISKVISK